jgi:AcrR family transcriptional regulator
VTPVEELADRAGPQGLRQRKKDRVRMLVADAALELFADRGFDDTTVAQVAARAGVSPATVARYFPTKESLLFPGQQRNTTALHDAIVARPANESPWSAVVAALTDVESDVGVGIGVGPDAEDRRRLVLSRRAIARSPALRGRASALLDVWRDTVADAATARGAAPEDARVLATVVVAVLDDAADRWALDGGASELATTIADAFSSLDRTHRRSP